MDKILPQLLLVIGPVLNLPEYSWQPKISRLYSLFTPPCISKDGHKMHWSDRGGASFYLISRRYNTKHVTSNHTLILI